MALPQDAENVHDSVGQWNQLSRNPISDHAQRHESQNAAIDIIPPGGC